MAMMHKRLEIPVVSLTDGTAIVIICPDMCTAGAYTSNFGQPPFVTVAAGSSTLPYAAVPSYGASAPFAGYTNQMSSFAVDSVQLDYLAT
jgi:hypothetical protein